MSSEDKPAAPSKLAHQNKRLKALLEKYKQSHHLQNALIQLSEQASSVAELTLLYPAIHDILQAYLPSKSFYVVLANQYTHALELSYFCDEKDWCGAHYFSKCCRRYERKYPSWSFCCTASVY